MPCRMDDMPRDYRSESASRSRQNETLKAKLVKLEPLEALLCSAARVLERLEYDFDENPELSAWWAKHKKSDDRRKKKEAKERIAAEAEIWRLAQVEQLLAKSINDLTDDERAILREAKVL